MKISQLQGHLLLLFLYISSLHLCSWIKAILDCWWCMCQCMSHICVPIDGMAGKYCSWMANTGVGKKSMQCWWHHCYPVRAGMKEWQLSCHHSYDSRHITIHCMTAVMSPFILWQLSHHHSWSQLSRHHSRYNEICHITIHDVTSDPKKICNIFSLLWKQSWFIRSNTVHPGSRLSLPRIPINYTICDFHWLLMACVRSESNEAHLKPILYRLSTETSWSVVFHSNWSYFM